MAHEKKDTYLDAKMEATHFYKIYNIHVNTLSSTDHSKEHFLAKASPYVSKVVDLQQKYKASKTQDEQYAICEKLVALTADFKAMARGITTHAKHKANTDGFAHTTSVYVPSFEQISSSTPSRPFSYDPVAHFRLSLKRATGESNCSITEEQLNQLREYFKAKHVAEKNVTPDTVLEALKNIRGDMAKYYDDRVTIAMRINRSFKPICIDPSHAARLTELFKCVLEKFENHKGKRKNFLNYSYTACKLCQIQQAYAYEQGDVELALKWGTYMDAFPLLKGADRLQQHDNIWRNICKDMKWPFYITLGNIDASIDFR